MRIIAIDPGTTLSAYCMIDVETYKPVDFAKIPNDNLLAYIERKESLRPYVVIEMVTSYGNQVGKDVFETVLWAGRFFQRAEDCGMEAAVLARQEVKLSHCNSSRAKDANIIQALKDRFGDKGTKAAPGWFYGFKADIWQAYALGVTFLDHRRGMNLPVAR